MCVCKGRIRVEGACVCRYSVVVQKHNTTPFSSPHTPPSSLTTAWHCKHDNVPWTSTTHASNTPSYENKHNSASSPAEHVFERWHSSVLSPTIPHQKTLDLCPMTGLWNGQRSPLWGLWIHHHCCVYTASCCIHERMVRTWVDRVGGDGVGIW